MNTFKWSEMYLSDSNSIYSATSKYNLNKLCWHTVALKPFLSCIFVRFCTVPSNGYWSSKGSFYHLKTQRRSQVQKSAPGKVRCQSFYIHFGPFCTCIQRKSYFGTELEDIHMQQHRAMFSIRIAAISPGYVCLLWKCTVCDISKGDRRSTRSQDSL